MSALTKMFVVLQLVFSLFLAVLLTLMVSKQQNYRDVATSAHDSAVISAAQVAADKGQLATIQTQDQNAQNMLNDANTKLADAQAQALKLQGDLDASKAQAASSAESAKVEHDNLTSAIQTATAENASANKELASLRPQVADLDKKNAELSRAKNEADNENRAAELAIRKLQEQIANASQTAPAAGTAGNESSVASLTSSNAAGAVNAKITDVQVLNGRTLVEMPLGVRDGIQSGTRVMIYRGNQYIGDAVVNRVTTDSSVAAVLGNVGANVHQGDMISTVGQ